MKLQFKSVETPLNTVLNTSFNVFAKDHQNLSFLVHEKRSFFESNCEQKLRTTANRIANKGYQSTIWLILLDIPLLLTLRYFVVVEMDLCPRRLETSRMSFVFS